MVLLLLACLTPKPSVESGTPAASLAARPTWAEHAGYAPGLSHELLLSAGPKDSLQAHTGPLRGGLLLCEVATTHRGDRARFFAARRGVDTSLPDTDTWLDVGAEGVSTTGPQNSDTARFAAPAVRLDVGDPLRASLMDRGVLRKHTYDTVTGTYGGELPMALSGETSEGWCGLVPQDRVDAWLKPQLDRADAGQRALEARAVDLSQLDFGRAGVEGPQQALRDAAALVGWERTPVSDRVAQVQAAEQAFDADLSAALAAAREGMPDTLTLGAAELRPLSVECPWFGYSRYGVKAQCAMEVELRADPAGEIWFEWVHASGYREPLSGWSSWVPAGADTREEARMEAPPPGQSVLLIVPTLRDQQPLAIRAWRGGESSWVAVPDPSR